MAALPARPLVRGTLIVPDQPAAAGIERETFIGAGYVHDAFHHHGRVLDLRDIRHGEDPARGEVRDVVLIDLGQFGETVAAGFAIISGPVGLRCHWPVAVARFAEQSDLFVVGAELQIERALVEHLAFQSRAGGELDLPLIARWASSISSDRLRQIAALSAGGTASGTGNPASDCRSH